MSAPESLPADPRLQNQNAFGVEECAYCYSLRLRPVKLNGQAAVECEDCEWVATFSYLREQARHD